MDYLLIISIIISVCFLLSILNYMDYLSGFSLIVSILVITNILLIVLIKLYNGRGFYCSDLLSKASTNFTFKKEFKRDTIDYVKNLKND